MENGELNSDGREALIRVKTLEVKVTMIENQSKERHSSLLNGITNVINECKAIRSEHNKGMELTHTRINSIWKAVAIGATATVITIILKGIPFA